MASTPRPLIFDKSFDILEVPPYYSLYFVCRAIAQLNPDDLGRVSGQGAAIAEIRIFRNDVKMIVAGVIPHDQIRRAIEAKRLHVSRSGEQVDQLPNQTRRKILVEQQLHAFTTICWCSLSAA